MQAGCYYYCCFYNREHLLIFWLFLDADFKVAADAKGNPILAREKSCAVRSLSVVCVARSIFNNCRRYKKQEAILADRNLCPRMGSIAAISMPSK